MNGDRSVSSRPMRRNLRGSCAFQPGRRIRFAVAVTIPPVDDGRRPRGCPAEGSQPLRGLPTGSRLLTIDRVCVRTEQRWTDARRYARKDRRAASAARPGPAAHGPGSDAVLAVDRARCPRWPDVSRRIDTQSASGLACLNDLGESARTCPHDGIDECSRYSEYWWRSLSALRVWV
jgi:hypothetical protein